jgi:hypothetical protein
MGEQLQPAQVMAVPSVPSVPPQKSKVQSESGFFTHSTATGRVWLAAVAHLLECSPDYLLAHDFIDQYDLVKHCSNSPQLAAQLISSHPAWTSAAVVTIGLVSSAASPATSSCQKNGPHGNFL